MTMLLGRNYRDAFERVVGLKLRTEALAVQLRAEKAVADAARHEAEVANRAKTQFFTAASHDLRQPLHAMGLFAEALARAQPTTPRWRSSSTASTNRSTRSRACSPSCSTSPASTAAASRCNPSNFELAEHLPQGAAALRADGVREGAGAAHPRRPRTSRSPIRCWSSASSATWSRTRSATPTTARCCVSCRRRGERLLLQVWDTGPGIRADERARIFEEFYQVPGDGRGQPPSRRRGSASAWRSSSGSRALMGAPLDAALASPAAARCSRSSCRSARRRARRRRPLAGQGRRSASRSTAA